jgi:succinate dehydrogenase subunit C
VEDAVSAPATDLQPRWYRPRMSVFWWVSRRSYLIFVLRELSSVFIAWSVVFLLLLIRAIGQGGSEYRRFLDRSGEPWMLALNALTLAFVLFHTLTWFNLAPHAMVVRLRGKRVPRTWIAGAHYAGWALITGLVAWLVLA